MGAKNPVQISSTASHSHRARKSGRKRPARVTVGMVGPLDKANHPKNLTDTVLQEFGNKTVQSTAKSSDIAVGFKA